MANLSDTARGIFKQALADCSIERAIADRVSLRDESLTIDDETISLVSLRNLRIVAVGKAASAMLQAVRRQLPALPDCDIAGVLIAPEPPSQLPTGFQYFAGGHPVPNEASFAGARAALDAVKSAAGKTTMCLFMISGGASAMMELPLDSGISLADTAAFHQALVASGASITEINCIRKHFSEVKGGRLALAARDSICHTLLVSDVPAGHEDALGSGPTLPDSSTVADCRKILARYGLLPQFPASVRNFFERDTLPETPKPADLHSKASVLLSSDNLAHAAADRAESLGWAAVIDNSCDESDYRDAAKYLLDRLRKLHRQDRGVCLISAGELIVKLPEAHSAPAGIGGRNQQFALYAATMFSHEDGEIAVLSAGSDGIDGNSPAAGAVVDQSLLSDSDSRAAALQALDRFDAHTFLSAKNATITTGPSGNNLRDLRILLCGNTRERPSPEFHKS